MFTVFGAGSVGTVLAGLLARAGADVRIAGGGAVADLRLEGDEEEVVATVPVVEEPEGTILLCVHEPDVEALCARWPGRTVVTFQNGVESEELAARRCRVIGAVWRMTCTLVEPGRARFTRRGRVIVGRHPEGVDDEVRALAAALRGAGLDVGLSERIADDKWLKLFVNLTSAPNALIRTEDHDKPEFGAVKRALLEEARTIFRAAGVEARSCDGRDRSMDEEIEHQAKGGGRSRPVHNATWRQLSRGLRVKELYHDVVVRLALERGLPAPCNAILLEHLVRARGVERLCAAIPLAAFERGRSCVVFDLDDTLIDTRRVLLPAALERVARAIGVDVGALNPSGKAIGEVLEGIEGLDAARHEAAAAAFYDPDVPDLEPLPDAVETLERLQGQARLFLLTRGDPKRQFAKVSKSGLGQWFESLHIHPIEGPGSKRDRLEQILRTCGLPPGRCAVVGDDERDELRHAADLGCLAVKVPDTPLAAIPDLLREAGL